MSNQNFFGYIRVSTAKQGQHGVSLGEQREAIERYAHRSELQLVRWFEEQETAAKRGRPVFGQMLKLLRQGKAQGVVIHKIDRSARNLKDWADLGELLDRGIDVRFANESLDLASRGGRLSADIQAVVAADFIRNLREETRKGMRGRLKQGLYPMPAPVGYVDRGKGKPKEPDPVMGPLVRRTFELYATERYTLETLLPELKRLGLRNRAGAPVTRSGLSHLLNNPFYFGLIRLRSTRETFPGVHQPLITKRLFDRVQAILTGKTHTKCVRHDFVFRRLLTCAKCAGRLIGEFQKGHVYYRCHTRVCPMKTIREEAVDDAILRLLRPLRLTDRERRFLDAARLDFASDAQQHAESHRAALHATLQRIAVRLQRLTDALLDGVVDQQIFNEKKNALLTERQQMQEQLSGSGPSSPELQDRLAAFLELAESAYLSYKTAEIDEKRDLVKITTSNRIVDGKTLAITLSEPFRSIAERQVVLIGVPRRGSGRTLGGSPAGRGKNGKWRRFIEQLADILMKSDLDLDVLKRYHDERRADKEGKAAA